MVAEVCLGKVGAVAAREVSRFARNSRDWQQLIEMCRVVDTVLVDPETVYAPRLGNDRLLLGLKGSLNEYEQDLLRQRSLAARHEKARCGELIVTAPVGYVKNGNRLEKDPDRRSVSYAPSFVSRSHRRRGSGGCRSGCRMRSPPTSADWPPAGSSSVPASPAPACDRPFRAPSTSPPCRAGRVSCGSTPCLPAMAKGEGADTQTVAVPPPTPAASAVAPRRPVASTDTDRPANPSPPDRTPAAASAPFLHRPVHRSLPSPGRQKFFPSISLSVDTSSIASANRRFSFAFFTSRLRSRSRPTPPAGHTSSATCRRSRR